MIGYYQIDINSYGSLSTEQKNTIIYHNNILFNMALKYNVFARTLLDMNNNNATLLSIIPIEILYIIIKLVIS